MRKCLTLTLAAVLAIFSGPLFAADLPLRRAPPQRQTYQPPPPQDEALPPPQTYQAPPQRFAGQPQCPYAGGPSPMSPCAGAAIGAPVASPCAIAASPCAYGGGPYLAGAYAIPYPPPFFGGFPGFGFGRFGFGRGFGFGHHFGFHGRI
jgi:hypothetical protein